MAADRKATVAIPWLGPAWRRLRYPAAGLVAAGLSLLALQLLVGRQLARQQMRELATGVAANVLLGQVALERFSPQALAGLSGMRLTVGSRPGSSVAGPASARSDLELWEQNRRLRAELCHRLAPCPTLQPTQSPSRGTWVEMGSSLETVWLFVPLPAAVRWPPDPWMLSLSLGIGGLTAGLLFQVMEVQRPLSRLEEALGQVGRRPPGSPLPQRGTASVRRLTGRFNTMVGDLLRGELERTTMLAGIAHDLRSPLTRLRLRLLLAAPPATPDHQAEDAPRISDPAAWPADLTASPQPEGPHPGSPPPPSGHSPTDTAGEPALGERRPDLAAAEADLDALERITDQFLVFAGADRQEAPVLLPLHALLAETAAAVGSVPLELDLVPLQRRVRPTSIGRAVRNLLENACAHGQPPLRLVLLPAEPDRDGGVADGEDGDEGGGGTGFEIQVWDRGSGISAADWPRALTPFLRLDGARQGQGHSGLGLAIAERIARDHGGGLRRLERDGAFGVSLWGQSLPGS